MELSEAPLDALYEELERRERLSPPARYRWRCDVCGHAVLGGEGLKGVHLRDGALWCACCGRKATGPMRRCALRDGEGAI